MTVQKSGDPKAFNDFEHKGWATVSDGYERHFAGLTRQTAAVTLDAAGLERGMRMLDVCTGPGQLAAAALQRGAAAVGLDFAKEVVDIAARNVPGGEFRQGDAQSLPFDDDSFDAVVCGYGVIHVPDPEKALMEMRRVLRPGGRMAVSVWAAPKPSNGFGILYGAVKQHGDLNVALPQGPDFFQFSNDDAMATALQGVGLGDVTAQPVAQTWALNGPMALIEAILEGTVRARGLLLAQTNTARAAIEAAVKAAMKQYETTAGQYEVPMPAVVGAGTK